MNSIIGLPIEWSDDQGDDISVLHALVVLKGIDKDGMEVDSVVYSDGLSLASSLGMARYAVLVIEDQVRTAIKEDFGED